MSPGRGRGLLSEGGAGGGGAISENLIQLGGGGPDRKALQRPETAGHRLELPARGQTDRVEVQGPEVPLLAGSEGREGDRQPLDRDLPAHPALLQLHRDVLARVALCHPRERDLSSRRRERRIEAAGDAVEKREGVEQGPVQIVVHADGGKAHVLESAGHTSHGVDLPRRDHLERTQVTPSTHAGRSVGKNDLAACGAGGRYDSRP
jgi:hypothetical protein